MQATDSGEDPEPEWLEGQEATRYRAAASTQNYLSADRVDIRPSVKKAAREMSKPSSRSMSLLKKIARFLCGKPRMDMHYKWQDPSQHQRLSVYPDSDYAGCVTFRKSTSGGRALIGQHLSRAGPSSKRP